MLGSWKTSTEEVGTGHPPGEGVAGPGGRGPQFGNPEPGPK
ncbi:MAG: hypothetical protein PWP23_1856 [Candidatus Sumerlaeota bacterium]|nr:hypothetical protein [Candidatus Sumerlaeota bacterium]